MLKNLKSRLKLFKNQSGNNNTNSHHRFLQKSRNKKKIKKRKFKIFSRNFFDENIIKKK